VAAAGGELTVVVTAATDREALDHPAGDARHTGARGVAPVVGRLAQRGVLGMVRIPATVIPVIVMPVFFTLAFSGAFSAITNIPGFPTDNILDWMVPFAVLQGASFAGFGAAFGAGRDLENGFYDRLLLSPVPRPALVLGPLVYSALRAMLPLAIVVPVGHLGGARIQGGLPGLLALAVAAVGIALLASLWGLGVVYRARSQRAGALVQAGIFIALFLSVGQVPLEVMSGWLLWVAERNPVTYILNMARQGYLGEVTWAETWPGLLALGVGAALLGLFAWRGFRKLVP
jgi:ABC-2 type transport system permease protein